MTGQTSHWYVARTEHHREKWAAENVSRQGAIPYCPQIIDTQKSRAHKLKFAKTLPLFPGYLFIQTENHRWTFLLGTYGIISVVMNASGPVPVHQRIIDGLKAREDVHGIVGLPKAQEKFQIGARARVTSGPFASCSGLIDGMGPDARIKILLDLLGRRVKVLIPEADLEAA